MGAEILSNILDELFNIEAIADEYISMLDYNEVFNCQQSLQKQVGINITPVIKVVFAYAFFLLVLKFSWKLFNTYLLGTDGDADADPVVVFTNFAKAVAVSLCFGLLFTYLLNISSEITQKVMSSLKLPATVNAADVAAALKDPKSATLVPLVLSGTLPLRVMFGIYTILAIVLKIKFVKNAIELVILRIGLAFSAVGLLDSDGGVFKPYIKKFFQICFAVLIQVACFKMSAYALTQYSFIWAFALISMAMTAPAFLQEFIMTNPGGGNKLQQALYSFSIMRSFTR